MKNACFSYLRWKHCSAHCSSGYTNFIFTLPIIQAAFLLALSLIIYRAQWLNLGPVWAESELFPGVETCPALAALFIPVYTPTSQSLPEDHSWKLLLNMVQCLLSSGIDQLRLCLSLPDHEKAPLLPNRGHKRKHSVLQTVNDTQAAGTSQKIMTHRLEKNKSTLTRELVYFPRFTLKLVCPRSHINMWQCLFISFVLVFIQAKSSDSN